MSAPRGTNHTVRLHDDTVGTMTPDSLDFRNPDEWIGEEVRIQLYDENGNEIEADGRLEEVLEVGEVMG